MAALLKEHLHFIQSYRWKEAHGRRAVRYCPNVATRCAQPMHARRKITSQAEVSPIGSASARVCPPAWPRHSGLREDRAPLLAPRCALRTTACMLGRVRRGWRAALTGNCVRARGGSAALSCRVQRCDPWASEHRHDPTESCRQRHSVDKASISLLAGHTAGAISWSATMLGFAA